DTTPPSVTIDQAATQADPTNTSPVKFMAVFSEPVQSLVASDISFAGSTVGGSLVASVSGSGPVYTISVSGITSDGLVKISIPAGGVLDLAGNANTASTSTDNTVTVDRTPPTVTVNQSAGQIDPVNAGPL